MGDQRRADELHEQGADHRARDAHAAAGERRAADDDGGRPAGTSIGPAT